MPEAVIGRALLRVFERLVGDVDVLEPRFGGVIAGMTVGMAFHRHAPERRF
jgi:hypothetical protein